MNSRCNCTYASVIIGVIAGIILGVLYTVGLVSTSIIFWAYILFGVLGVLLSPIYASSSGFKDSRCFCRSGRLISVSSLGTVVSSAIGLIVAPLAPIAVIGVVLGLATFFFTMLIVSVICLAICKS